jgi:hypothetical protein
MVAKIVEQGIGDFVIRLIPECGFHSRLIRQQRAISRFVHCSETTAHQPQIATH